MTLTGFWKRIDDWVYSLESGDELAWAHQEMNERLEHYDYALDDHFRNGGSVSSRHDWTFRFIVRKCLDKIERRTADLSFLDSTITGPIA